MTSPVNLATSSGSRSRLMSAASLLSMSKEEKNKLLNVNSSHSKLTTQQQQHHLLPEVRCTLASPEAPRNDPANEDEEEDKNSRQSSSASPIDHPSLTEDRIIVEEEDKIEDEKDVVPPLSEAALEAGLDRARKRREAFRTFSMKQSEV